MGSLPDIIAGAGHACPAPSQVRAIHGSDQGEVIAWLTLIWLVFTALDIGMLALLDRTHLGPIFSDDFRCRVKLGTPLHGTANSVSWTICQ